MEMKKIYVFTIATDMYKGYIPFLEASLANLSPLSKVFDVELILISDIDCISETPHKYLHICNMPYPFNAYHKFDYIHDAISFLNLEEDGYFIYVDADSIFRKMEVDFYEKTIPQLLCNNTLTLARSPWRFTKIIQYENDNCKGTPSYISGQGNPRVFSSWEELAKFPLFVKVLRKDITFFQINKFFGNFFTFLTIYI